MGNIDPNVFILYSNIIQEEIVLDTISIYNELLNGKDISCRAADYYKIQKNLLSEMSNPDFDGSCWQNYICRMVAKDDNPFTRMAEKGETNENLKRLALREIKQLKTLYQLDWKRLEVIFHDTDTSVGNMQVKPNMMNVRSARRKAKEAIETESDEETLELLQGYYKEAGCGTFECYDAFIWDNGLVGVQNHDPITFDQLIGYERQKKMLIDNTCFLLDGFKANNVLLYGDRGTGKSSCVKALLNRFKNQKLKMISLDKSSVKDLYKIIDEIRNRGCKFIIFIDDLSFEETETGYKYFKSVIDGGIEAQPLNTLIYVTSNRRNIIRETWNDRSEASGDVHSSDGMQERLSLADRFGLSITFSSPDKNTYLDIVKGIAKQEALDMEENILTAEALRWELKQHGRSGRAARQFINHMQGKQFTERNNKN